MNWRTLKGDLITFEPLSESIIPSLHAYASDPNVSRYIGWPLMKNIDDSKAYYNQLIENEKNETHEYASIMYHGQHIGTIMLFNFSKEAKNLEIGYVLNSDYWGKGITSEAVKLLMDYLLEHTDTHKVCARVVSGNMASARVLEKYGFVSEGCLKDQYYIDEKYYDALYYGYIR